MRLAAFMLLISAPAIVYASVAEVSGSSNTAQLVFNGMNTLLLSYIATGVGPLKRRIEALEKVVFKKAS